MLKTHIVFGTVRSWERFRNKKIVAMNELASCQVVRFRSSGYFDFTLQGEERFLFVSSIEQCAGHQNCTAFVLDDYKVDDKALIIIKTQCREVKRCYTT